jgi:hypothetical protein
MITARSSGLRIQFKDVEYFLFALLHSEYAPEHTHPRNGLSLILVCRFLDPDCPPHFMHCPACRYQIPSCQIPKAYGSVSGARVLTCPLINLITDPRAILEIKNFLDPRPHATAVLKLSASSGDVRRCLAFAYWDVCYRSINAILSESHHTCLPPSVIRVSVKPQMSKQCSCPAEVRTPSCLWVNRTCLEVSFMNWSIHLVLITAAVVANFGQKTIRAIGKRSGMICLVVSACLHGKKLHTTTDNTCQ